MPDLYEAIWQYRIPMLRLAVTILHHPQNAEDAVSAAMVHAIRNGGSLRSEAALKSWLLKITARCCFDLLRREKKQQTIPAQPAFTLFESADDTLFAQLTRLPAPLAQVLNLYYYENLTTQEIAQTLAISAATVRMRLSRGRKKLRVMLEEDEA